MPSKPEKSELTLTKAESKRIDAYLRKCGELPPKGHRTNPYGGKHKIRRSK